MRKSKLMKLNEGEKLSVLTYEERRELKRKKLEDYLPKSASSYLVREIELLKMENEDLKRRIEELQDIWHFVKN